MITYSEARKLVEEELNGLVDSHDTVELVIVDSATIGREWGWIFFYQGKRHLETSDPLDALGGNAPYIVNRYSGEIVMTGTAYPIEDYIKEYEGKLDKNGTI